MDKLTVVTAKPDHNLITLEKDSDAQNKPFTRHEKILAKLTETSAKIYTIDTTDKMLQETTKELLDLKMASKEYMDFLANAWDSFNNAGKPNAFAGAGTNGEGLTSYIFSREKLNKIQKLPYYIQSGIYGNDTFTPIFSHTYRSALISAQTTLEACSLLDKSNIVYCLTPFPGHHATTNSYSGYCFLNNAGICAEQLLKTKSYKKVCILDLDFHHGDGTQKIFYDRSDVLTVSIHGCPLGEYPYFTGYSEEIGQNTGVKYNINYPLKGGVKLQEYLSVLTDALTKIQKYDPDILVLAFGADTFKDDEEVLDSSRFSIDLDDYKKIGQTVAKLNKKTIVTQEGGYMMDCVAQIVTNFLEGLLTPLS